MQAHVQDGDATVWRREPCRGLSAEAAARRERARLSLVSDGRQRRHPGEGLAVNVRRRLRQSYLRIEVRETRYGARLPRLHRFHVADHRLSDFV